MSLTATWLVKKVLQLILGDDPNIKLLEAHMKPEGKRYKFEDENYRVELLVRVTKLEED